MEQAIAKSEFEDTRRCGGRDGVGFVGEAGPADVQASLRTQVAAALGGVLGQWGMVASLSLYE